MRLSIAILAFLLAELGAAFVVDSSTTSSHRQHGTSSSPLNMAAAETKSTKPTTAADILARARKAAGMPEEEEDYPKIFEDDLLDDMQQILLTLEKRVKEGPGAVTLLEIDQMQAMQNKIMTEMREKENERLNGVSSAAVPAATSTPAAVASTTPAGGVVSTEQSSTPAAPTPEAAQPRKIIDTSNDDLANYDGTGGMGLAKGTANTYIIDGMDAMSPEEYQKALQETISARQRKRIADGKTTGNRATWDYLNQLTGEPGVLKKEEYEK